MCFVVQIRRWYDNWSLPLHGILAPPKKSLPSERGIDDFCHKMCLIKQDVHLFCYQLSYHLYCPLADSRSRGRDYRLFFSWPDLSRDSITLKFGWTIAWGLGKFLVITRHVRYPIGKLSSATAIHHQWYVRILYRDETKRLDADKQTPYNLTICERHVSTPIWTLDNVAENLVWKTIGY